MSPTSEHEPLVIDGSGNQVEKKVRIKITAKAFGVGPRYPIAAKY